MNKKDKINCKKEKQKREGWSVVKQRMLEAGENVDDVYGTSIGLIPEKTMKHTTINGEALMMILTC